MDYVILERIKYAIPAFSLKKQIQGGVTFVPKTQKIYISTMPLRRSIPDQTWHFSFFVALPCLRHPYLSTYHDSEDEPECDEIYDETIEREERDVEGWRRLTWDEYKSFEPPIFDSDSEDETETDSDETDSSDDDSQGTQDYDSNDAEEY